MAGRQKESDIPDLTISAKKSIGIIGILICFFVASLVINGVFWIVDRNIKIHNAEEALSELKTAAYSAEKADGGSYDVSVRNMALQTVSTAQSSTHGIVLEDRKNMTLTGVREVSEFDEHKIVLLTELGQLTITGSMLHIIIFSPNTGDLSLDGTIDSLVYTDENKNKPSLLEKIKGIPKAIRERLNL